MFTKPPIADPFQLFMARIAGVPVRVIENGHVLEAFQYKGILYVSSFKKVT